MVGSRPTAEELSRPNVANGWAVAAKGGERAMTACPAGPPPTGSEMRFVTLVVTSIGRATAARPTGAGVWPSAMASPRKDWSLRLRLAWLSS